MRKSRTPGSTEGLSPQGVSLLDLNTFAISAETGKADFPVKNIKKYYNAFTSCNDPKNLADLTPFLIMMLGMIKSAMEDLKTSLSEKLFRWNRY